MKRKGQGTRYILQSHTTNDLLRLTRTYLSMFLLSSNNSTKLWLCQWFNPFMKSETSWSNHFLESLSLNIVALGSNPSAHDPLWETLHIQTITSHLNKNITDWAVQITETYFFTVLKAVSQIRMSAWLFLINSFFLITDGRLLLRSSMKGGGKAL
jgi:hypothetical protein